MTDRASSGVRNLRAMFENPSAASSPEPRGRSPASRADPDSTSRPTSKIRASFVSVEPSGHVAKDLGTTKGTPSGINAPQANRRGSFSISEDAGGDVATDLKKVVSEEKEARKNSAVIPEAVPEEAVASRESSRPAPPIRGTSNTMPDLGSIMKGSDFAEEGTKAGQKLAPKELPVDAAVKPDHASKQVEEKAAAPPSTGAPTAVPDAQEPSQLKHADVKNKAGPQSALAPLPHAEVAAPATTAVTIPESSKTDNKPAPKANVNGSGTHAVSNGKPTARKPAAISTSKAPATKATSLKSPVPKSPTVSRSYKAPSTPKATPSAPSAARSPAVTKESSKPAAAKESVKAPAPKSSRASLRPSTVGTTASAAAKTKPPIQDTKKATAKSTETAPRDVTTTSPSGFKKPKPRSPTRPVRLPSHLTAPTASSAAKHEDDTQKLVRKPSTISRPAAPKTVPTAHRKPSRASLAPSTAPTAKRPDSRASTKGAPDEGFLARMMRPTAASSSKTHEKVSSPPRRAPSVKAPTQPKAGHESVIEKGKRKVEEVAAKAKEAVSNGHGNHDASKEPVSAEHVTSNGTTSQEPHAPIQTGREATPVDQVESSAVELQTPNFEGQAIR